MKNIIFFLSVSAFSDSDDDSKKKKKKIDKITEQNTLQNSKVSRKQTIPKNNPLLTDLDNTDPASRRSMKAELWFQKDVFKDIDEDDDEGVDLDKLAETYTEKGRYILIYGHKGGHEVGGSWAGQRLVIYVKSSHHP